MKRETKLQALIYSLFISVTSFSAYAAHTTPHPHADPTCAEIISGHPTFQETHDQVQAKVQTRNSMLGHSSGPLLLRDDGQEPTHLKDGMANLFNHSLLVKDVSTTRDAFNALAEKWIVQYRATIDLQLREALADRKAQGKNLVITQHENGIYQSTFLDRNQNVFLTEIDVEATIDDKGRSLTGVAKRDYRKMTMSQQESWLRERLVKRITREVRDMRVSITQAGRVLAEKLNGDYNDGTDPTPNFAKLRSEMENQFNTYKTLLSEQYPIVNITPEISQLMNFTALSHPKVTLDSHGRWHITLTQAQSTATYIPEVAAVKLEHFPPKNAAEASLIVLNENFMHGTGTNQSNVASFAPIFDLAKQAGVHAIGMNLPGAGGERGVGLNSIRKTFEMGVYVEDLNIYALRTSPNPKLPFGYVGRSMGSTIGFASLVTLNWQHREPVSEFYKLTSFSNPRTMDLQTKNVYDQVARGDIKMVLDDAIRHADNFCIDFQRHLEQDKKLHPNDPRRFNDSALFVQGEADEDGGPNVVGDLISYRDDFAKYAHIYIFEDPLKPYKERGLLTHFKPIGLEATHNLYSARDNMTEATRGQFPKEIPEKDLPKLRDQYWELYALDFAMLDYLIDLSPVHPAQRREGARQARLDATKSDQKSAYLKWFIETILNPNIETSERRSLEQILADSSIQPNRQSGVYGRIKKVYIFMLDEAHRIQNLENALKAKDQSTVHSHVSPDENQLPGSNPLPN